MNADVASDARALSERDRKVRRVLVIEGVANLAVVVAKTVVGTSSGSVLLLSEAIHSFADLSNNAVAFVAMGLASAPPDREHPYGHRKFETLAVFGLAILLAVLAVEIALRGLERGDRAVVRTGWGLAVMLGVLAVNASVAIWEGRAARRLDSDLLRADAGHTVSDVLTTCAVIVGWQLAASGYPWLDRLLTLAVAALILYLAYGLFQRAIPVLVDQMVADPRTLAAVIGGVPGVRSTRRVRSLGSGVGGRIDVVVTVDATLSTAASHRISEEVERRLRETFATEDVTVHVEPDA